jgi:AraC family transcriptional regulator, regulatory protein of adaptative response / DNA-3-methyladenine glycosylase II
MLTDLQCQQARLSRDHRFDGMFYIAVKSTGIYCRPICPARAPAEHQVHYFQSAAAAAHAGFRPCLRCRPDSAPGSPAWLGTQTTLRRALTLISEGALIDGDQATLSERLGISERYLRKLFAQHLGVAPKQYALYQQILFAKSLLHQTDMPVADIAMQAGFHSVRRFNDAFIKQLKLSPGQIRRRRSAGVCTLLELELNFRPPLNFGLLLEFWHKRSLTGVEWLNEHSYGRTFCWPAVSWPATSAINNGKASQNLTIEQRSGWFEVRPKTEHSLALTLHWPYPDGLTQVVAHIRRLLDLDADLLTVEQSLQPMFGDALIPGLRIPGVWSAWEAAVRAVLGQQVSVAGARMQLNRLVEALSEQVPDSPSLSVIPTDLAHTPNLPPSLASNSGKKLFPTPAQVLASDLHMIKVPQARRDTLKALAAAVMAEPEAAPESWLAIKGIGPWTVAYSKMRGLSDSDIWLAGDLGIQKALQQREHVVDPATLSPWRSYATLQLWFGLAPAKKNQPPQPTLPVSPE